MINRTRVTVDEATREVLDQLSTELARTPSWTQQFSDDLQLAFAETFRDLQTGQARALEPLAASIRALQSQLGHQGNQLSAVAARLQTLDERMDGLERIVTDVRDLQARLLADAGQAREVALRQESALESTRREVGGIATQAEALQAAARSHAERLAGLQQALGHLDERVAQQAPAVACLVDELARLVEMGAQGSAQAVAQRRELEAFRLDHQTAANHQGAAQEAVTGLLQQSAAMLQEVSKRQATQQEALERLARDIDSLHRPWWRRIFHSSRSST